MPLIRLIQRSGAVIEVSTASYRPGRSELSGGESGEFDVGDVSPPGSAKPAASEDDVQFE